MAYDVAKDRQALELRLAGVAAPKIKEMLGYRTTPMVEAAIRRARDAQSSALSPAKMRELELDRIERLQQAVWARAVKGDLAAVDRVLALGSARMRIAAMEETAAETPMIAAFNRTVAELGVQDNGTYASLVAAGLRIAGRIDASAGSLDAVAETKALYLIPHLMNVLRELGATPAARAEVAGAAPVPPEGKANDLEAFRKKHGIG